jgi:transcriptional regulator with XRE-family HTH domain
MSLTAFGRIVRHRRVDLGMTLGKMADALGVSSAFLSAVELGRSSVPEGWADKLKEILCLDEETDAQVRSAIEGQSVNRSIGRLGDSGLQKVSEELMRVRHRLSPDDWERILEVIRTVSIERSERNVA